MARLNDRVCYVCPNTLKHRAAIVTGVNDDDTVSLHVMRPLEAAEQHEGGFDHTTYDVKNVKHCEKKEPGTYHIQD